MCGISGVIPLNNEITTAQMMEWISILLKGNMSRGRDSTGIATFDRGVTPVRVDMFKGIGDADAFLKVFKEEYIVGPTICHNRAATCGPYTNNNNNHPLYGEKYCIIHNGVVHMPKIENYPYRGECDTELILSYIETYGFEEGVKKIDGSACIALFNVEEETFHLYKHTNPLYLLYIPGLMIAFSSTENPLKEIVRKTPIHKIYGLFPSAHLIEADEGMYLKLNVMDPNSYSLTNIKIEPSYMKNKVFCY